jgi:hypothetical protein
MKIQLYSSQNCKDDVFDEGTNKLFLNQTNQIKAIKVLRDCNFLTFYVYLPT